MGIVVPAFNCAFVQLSEDQYKSLNLARGLTAAVCLLLCLLTLALIIYYRTFQLRIQRLFLYLTLSTIAYLAVLAMQIEHYFNYLGQARQLCKAIGFLLEYTGSIQLLFTFGIAVYLVFIVLKVYRPLTGPAAVTKKIGNALEVLYIIVSMCLPLCFVWIPFVEVPYGEMGPWCWIQLEQNCTTLPGGYLEVIFIWYVPFGLFAFGSSICVLLVLITFCKWRCTSQTATKQLIIKETLLVFAFMVNNGIVCAVDTAIHTYMHKTNVHRYFPLMVYAISTPIGSAMIPIAFLIYLNSTRVTRLLEYCSLRFSCRACCCALQKDYVYLDSSGNADATIKPSQPSNLPSETCLPPNNINSEYHFSDQLEHVIS